MTEKEAIKKLEFHSKQICHGCMYPSMVGWCENHCQLLEAFKMAIAALKKQDIDKCCETCKHADCSSLQFPCNNCYRNVSPFEDYYEAEEKE